MVIRINQVIIKNSTTSSYDQLKKIPCVQRRENYGNKPILGNLILELERRGLVDGVEGFSLGD
jgi:hypothetical protein